MDQGWVAVIGAAVGSIGATGAAAVAGWSGRRQASIQAASQQDQWRRQLRRETYGALLSAGAEARDELGSVFAALPSLPVPEERVSIRARLDETKRLINAVRLATAAVYVEGPPSILEPAKRVEEGLVLFHTAMTALATGPSDASGEFAAAYRATCAQQRVGVRNALMDFASAARRILDGDSRPVPLEQPAPTQDSAEELSHLLSAMASALGEEQLTLDADKTLWENGFDSLLIMQIVHFLRRDHGWDLEAVWFFEMGDQSVRQMAGHLAALRTSGSIPAARGDSRQRHLD